MAKKTPEKKKKKKKKSSRNALIVIETKTKGRAPNKTVEKKVKSKPLGTRLHCVLVTPKKSRREARFECYGNKHDAMAAALGMDAPMPVPPPRAFSPSNLALMEKEMKGLRGRRGPLPARGLRGTPEEHLERAEALIEAAQSEEPVFAYGSLRAAGEELRWVPSGVPGGEWGAALREQAFRQQEREYDSIMHTPSRRTRSRR